MLAAAVVIVASLAGWWLGAKSPTSSGSYQVVSVLDGDTIVVRGPDGTETVRLLGVDTPETHHPTEPVGCYGPEAARYTHERLAGETVDLVGDIESHDQYGRRLAYVILAGERFNDKLLRQGYATLLVIEPNHAHARAMLRAELDAQRARRGLWGACEL